MIFGFVMLAVAVTISFVAAYYSIMGLTAIFAAAVVPIIIMGSALELGKVISTIWLHNNWARVPRLFKVYLVPAVAFLMFLTSMGIFGFLSKAHTDQSLVSGDVGAKIAIYDEKIRTSRDNIDANRRALTQMDAAVDQTMSRSNDEKGADKAVAIRRGQQGERGRLLKEIEQEQKKISALNEEAAPIRAEVRKVEAEVGPIKYIAALVYGDAVDANLLEKAVRWVIILIVVVFDPLALTLILASNKQFEWALKGEGGWVHDQPKPREPFNFKEFFANLKQRIRTRFKKKETLEDLVEQITPENVHTETDIIQIDLTPKRKPRAKKPVVKATPVVKPKKPAKKKVKPLVKEKPKAKLKTKVKPAPVDKPKVTRKKKLNKIVEEPTPIVEEFVSPNAPGLDASIERPGDYLKIEEIQVPPEPPREAAPGRNRGIITGSVTAETGQRVKIVADNTPTLGRASHSDFGNSFPANPEKGDVYLRTDYLPNRLYKYNGQKWLELDKNQIDVYAYDEAYIKHLVAEIDAGRYDPELLTDVEREQIKKYLN